MASRIVRWSLRSCDDASFRVSITGGRKSSGRYGCWLYTMKKGEKPVAEWVLELYAISASARCLCHSCGLWFANS